MENNPNPGGISHAFLADLLDDFTPAELTSLLNYLAIKEFCTTRGNIKSFRKLLNKPK